MSTYPADSYNMFVSEIHRNIRFSMMTNEENYATLAKHKKQRQYTDLAFYDEWFMHTILDDFGMYLEQEEIDELLTEAGWYRSSSWEVNGIIVSYEYLNFPHDYMRGTITFYRQGQTNGFIREQNNAESGFFCLD